MTPEPNPDPDPNLAALRLAAWFGGTSSPRADYSVRAPGPVCLLEAAEAFAQTSAPRAKPRRPDRADPRTTPLKSRLAKAVRTNAGMSPTNSMKFEMRTCRANRV